ncbi:uncharacterized protein LOC134250144 [Saccostrea cucullata]|uniref:uncharacterized protein LOC134250144 n=1 Tax=Saccostrea cuccullata TaxID=36930 RepID=UPI002ED60780
MIEYETSVFTERNNLPIQCEKEKTSIIKRNEKDYGDILFAHSCGSGKENDIFKNDEKGNDYGNFEENCQYSVLSLRRNFDPSEMECYAMEQSLRSQFLHNIDDPYCLTNIRISKDHRSLDDYDSDSDVGLSSKHSEDSSQKNCPLGTFGVNCSASCKEGFYGRLCRSECNCSTEDCDKEYGCKKRKSASEDETVKDKSVWENVSFALIGSIVTVLAAVGLVLLSSRLRKPRDDKNQRNATVDDSARGDETVKDKSVWENVSFALIGSIVTVLAAVGLVLLSSRLRKPRDDKNQRNATVDESTREDAQQLESPVINTSQQGIQNEVNENVYADVRSSKMIEFHCEGFSSNRLHIYSEDDETDAFLTNKNAKRNVSKDSKDANDKKKQTSKMNLQENMYGFSAETSQYSVLSLRRNVDPSEMENYFIKESIRCDTSQNEGASYCMMNVLETDNQENEEICESDSDDILASEPYSIAMRKHDEA